MMKIKNKKILILTLLTTLGVISNASTVYADEDTPYISIDNDTNQSSTNSTGLPQQTDSYTASDNYTITCTWKSSVEKWSKVYLNVYDSEGNKINDVENIGKSLSDQNLKQIKAGRYIGLNLYEENGYKILYSYDVTAKRTPYQCSRCKKWCSSNEASPSSYNLKKKNNDIKQLAIYGPPEEDISGGGQGENEEKPCSPGTCIGGWETKIVYDANECNNAVPLEEETRDPTSDEIDWCKGKAIPSTPELKPSYIVNYLDSNDINLNPGVTGYTGGSHYGSECNSTSEPGNEDGMTTISRKCRFQYNKGNACIDVHTAKIRYIGASETCEQNEYIIKSKNDVWAYFIPLNTKSSEGFSFTMNPSGNKQSKEMCLDAIEKYPDSFKKKITDENGNSFLPTDNVHSAKTKVEGGCYYKTTITIPIEQKFYNEITNGTAFKGFNFYYKPIPTDLSNVTNIEQKVFPNGIIDSSLWKEWYDKTANDESVAPNLKNENITYVANINNINKIRNHNATYPYTTWSNMSVSGASSFITNNTDIFTAQDDNYYKLGCGPANEKQYLDEAQKIPNILYQKECGIQ